MARHEVIILENPGLGELAPYTGNYISKGNVHDPDARGGVRVVGLALRASRGGSP